MRATKEHIKNTRNEFVRKTFRERMCKELGDECYNCGSVGDIEYHHIVPVVYGGTNNLNNIVPLCFECHYKAHSKSNAEGIKEARKNGSIGRKHKVPYEHCLQYIHDYIFGKIGKREFKFKCGYSEKYKLDKCSYIERYKKENNIKKFKNLINVVTANGILYEGRNVGYIIFDNGNIQELYYMT